MKKGFFNKSQIKSIKIGRTPLSCASCGLYKNNSTPRMPAYGKFRKGVLFIGEAPGKRDDRKGKPFQGPDGFDLEQILDKIGFNLFRDGLSTFACACQTPKNRKPSGYELSCCRPKLIQLINEYKPKVVVLLGTSALTSIVQYTWKPGAASISQWRGFQIPDRTLNTWICPVYHPSFVDKYEKNNQKNLARVIWQNDLKKALSKINEPVIFEDESKYITYVNTDSEFKNAFNRINKADLMAFDYETTGLKPHAFGHQIVTVSAAISEKEVYVWMNSLYRAKLFKQILENPKIKKIAHNLSYEDLWSTVIFKAVVQNWYWDSLNNSHILDNRTGIHGLKLQTYLNFGVPEYDGLVSPFISSSKESGANSFNKILEFVKKYGVNELMKYCGLDSLYTFKLSLLQKKLMQYL